jgi:hypothetical protein
MHLCVRTGATKSFCFRMMKSLSCRRVFTACFMCPLSTTSSFTTPPEKAVPRQTAAAGHVRSPFFFLSLTQPYQGSPDLAVALLHPGLPIWLQPSCIGSIWPPVVARSGRSPAFRSAVVSADRRRPATCVRQDFKSTPRAYQATNACVIVGLDDHQSNAHARGAWAVHMSVEKISSKPAGAPSSLADTRHWACRW